MSRCYARTAIELVLQRRLRFGALIAAALPRLTWSGRALGAVLTSTRNVRGSRAGAGRVFAQVKSAAGRALARTAPACAWYAANVASPISATFVGSRSGTWRIQRCAPAVGEGLPVASHLSIHHAANDLPAAPAFVLRGSTGHVRYVDKAEKATLAKVTPALGRAECSLAALIPIRKTDAWWELAQDERRSLIEERSRHISLGLKYLPAIARRLYHARELGEAFDFLTWFEYAPAHANLFEELVAALRESEEWRYVEREVDVRLERAG